MKNNEASEVIPKVVVGGESGYHVKKERYGCGHQHKRKGQNRKYNMISFLFFGLILFCIAFWSSIAHILLLANIAQTLGKDPEDQQPGPPPAVMNLVPKSVSEQQEIQNSPRCS